MYNLNDAIKGGTCCLTNPAIVIDADVEVDAEVGSDTFDYAINGILYTDTSGDGDIKLDNHTVTAGHTVIFLVCVDTAHALSVVKGTEVANADLTAGNAVLHWPEPTANTCPIGALKVKNATSSVFTGGTTELDAADITTTVYNLFTVPTAPLTS